MSRGAQGLRAWLVQRVSAVYLGLFVIYGALHFALSGAPDYTAWSAWFGHPLVAIAWGLFVVSLLVHAWVGVRDVLIDYVHPLGMRLAAMALVVFVLLGCGLWALRALLWPALDG